MFNTVALPPSGVGKLYMFEKKTEKVLSAHLFARRMAYVVLLLLALMAAALGLGVAGYYWIADLSLIDAVFNASMILTGMGPASELSSAAAKLFASAYAIFSAFVFVILMGIFLAPIAHRIMHRFHMDGDE
jgi:hypothetical protein